MEWLKTIGLVSAAVLTVAFVIWVGFVTLSFSIEAHDMGDGATCYVARSGIRMSVSCVAAREGSTDG